MEDVPNTYQRDPADDGAPVCPDGTSRQQRRETRTPLPTQPGRPAAHHFGHGRNGTASLFMMTAPLDGWRHVKVTDRRTRRDFARVLRDLADTRFPDRRIIPVMDNPDTHTLSTPCDTFPPAGARRPAERSGVHHTPKHGSWLNMAETGINVLARQCPDRRIPDRETPVSEVAAWRERRNAGRRPVNWRFRTEDARIRLRSLYPSIQ